MFLEGSSSVSVKFNETNSTRRFQLCNVNGVVGSLAVAREHHDVRVKFMVESLRLTCYLQNSLASSPLPNIYPEDGDAEKLRKFVESNESAPQISLKLTNESSVEMAIVPLTWKGMPLHMNLLKPWLVTGESTVLLLGENQSVWAELQDDGYGLLKPPRQLDQGSYNLDYIQITGMVSYTVSGVKKNRLITSRNLGVDVSSSTPTQVLASNNDRCKLIIQNKSNTPISIAFSQWSSDARKDSCLEILPNGTFNEEFYPCNPLPIWALAHSGTGKLLIREDTGVRI